MPAFGSAKGVRCRGCKRQKKPNISLPVRFGAKQVRHVLDGTDNPRKKTRDPVQRRYALHSKARSKLRKFLETQGAKDKSL